MQFLNRWYEVFDSQVGPSAVETDFSGEAAVLIPVTLQSEPQLILTRRALHLSTHPGQVSFPGGMWEPGDNGLEATALRETREEIGLPMAEIKLVGGLSRRISRHGVGVTPYAALVEPTVRTVASPDEIDSIFRVPLRYFLEQVPHRIDQIERKGVRYHMPAWFWEEHEIWGLTALILAEFCQTICRHPEASGEWALTQLEERL